MNFKLQLIALLLCSTLTATVASAQWNSVQTLDATGNTGLYSSILYLNGYVMVAYSNNSSVDLKFIRSTNDTANNWISPITIESVGQTGRVPDMIEVSGRPAIAYYDATYKDLKYVRAADGNGSTWDTIRTVVSAGDVGGNPSMVIANGAPAICYFKGGTLDLMYVRATNGQGSVWGTPVTVASSGNVGIFSSMVIVDDNPAIAYFDNTNGEIVYVRANDANGTSWGTPVTVDVIGTGTANMDLSMKVVNGVPAIAYYDVTDKDLKFAYAANATGSSWNTPLTLASTSNTGKFPCLSVINGRPAISYYGRYNDLYYIRASNAVGSSWPTSSETVYSTGKVGAWSSITEVNDKGYISFLDVGKGDLLFINESAARSKPGRPTVVGVSQSEDGKVTMYPNPASSVLNIEYSQISEGAKVYLLDISGRLLNTEEIKAGSSGKISFDVSKLPGGTYFIKVKGADISFTEKFVKQ